MITPFFTVDQDEEFLYVSVKVSHIRFSAQSIEMVADAEVFVFSLSPYYLRLRLPFSVVDDERSSANFDSKEGLIKIKLPKMVKGQYFPDLDLTAKLLARKDETGERKSSKPLIEDLDVTREIKDNQSQELLSIADEGEVHDWEIKQEVESPELNSANYGFNNAYNGIIGVSLSSGNDINDLGDPESSLPSDRIIERLIKENIKFDPDYYAADYIMEKNPEEEVNSGMMNWKSPSTKQFLSWYKLQQQKPKAERDLIMKMEFSNEDHEKMHQLPRRSYLVEKQYKPELFMLILTLLFGHQYDLRVNEGDHNIESAWTIGKLSPQLSCLDSQIIIPNELSTNILEATIINVTRRSLCYPLHRNYDLSKKVWDDVYYVLRSGKRVVLKCLLEVRELFRFHDVYYVYDKIWLEDLCSWIISDQVSENSLRSLAHDLKRKLEALKKTDITFEKIDETQSGETMIVIDIDELEKMSDESHNEFMG